MTKTPNELPNFIAARDPMGLRRLMLETNARLGQYTHYFDIQYADIGGKKQWVAWFYETIADDVAMREMIPDDNKK